MTVRIAVVGNGPSRDESLEVLGACDYAVGCNEAVLTVPELRGALAAVCYDRQPAQAVLASGFDGEVLSTWAGVESDDRGVAIRTIPFTQYGEWTTPDESDLYGGNLGGYVAFQWAARQALGWSNSFEIVLVGMDVGGRLDGDQVELSADRRPYTRISAAGCSEESNGICVPRGWSARIDSWRQLVGWASRLGVRVTLARPIGPLADVLPVFGG